MGKGFSAWAPRTVNNKAGAAARDRYFPGSNKVGLAAFAPTPLPPRPGEITVCKNGAKWAESQGSVAVIAPPCRYDVSFSSAKLLVSCKACSRPGARRDGRVERCVLTGGSAEGRRGGGRGGRDRGCLVCARACVRVCLHTHREPRVARCKRRKAGSLSEHLAPVSFLWARFPILAKCEQ